MDKSYLISKCFKGSRVKDRNIKLKCGKFTTRIFLAAKKQAHVTYDVIYLIWVEKLTDEIKATTKLPVPLIEKFVTEADASTGKVSFTASSLDFVTVSQGGQNYYNVFGQMRLHHRLFQLIH